MSEFYSDSDSEMPGLEEIPEAQVKTVYKKDYGGFIIPSYENLDPWRNGESFVHKDLQVGDYILWKRTTVLLKRTFKYDGISPRNNFIAFNLDYVSTIGQYGLWERKYMVYAIDDGSFYRYKNETSV